MNMSYATTENFTSGARISGNLARKIDLANYRDVCKRSLKDIRKETENGMKKKKADKKHASNKNSNKSIAQADKTKKNSANIVESAIGKSASETLNALDKLKSNPSKKAKTPVRTETTFDKVTVKEEPVKVQVKEEIKPVIVEQTSKSTTEVKGGKNTEQFTGTTVFEKDEEPATKAPEEPEGIDIVEFLHRVSTLEQVQAFASVMLDCEFYVSHTENNGSALYSEIITCLDRITGEEKHLLDFVCKNISAYKESLVTITDLCIGHCKKHPANTKLAETLEKLRVCMR